MAKKKQSTTQNQQGSYTGNTTYNNQNQYGWQQTPDSADIQAFRAYRPQVDPSISYGAAEQKNRLNSSFVNPLGGNLTAGMRDRLQQAGNRQIDQDASQAFRAGQYDVNQQRAGQLGSLAALTAPRLVQTGSSGTGSSIGSSTNSGTSNTTQGNNLFGDILQIGQAGAGLAML